MNTKIHVGAVTETEAEIEQFLKLFHFLFYFFLLFKTII